MKHIITHINPHLDEIFAIWLIEKFHPEAQDVSVDFVPSGDPSTVRYQGVAPDTDPDFFFLGVGGGEFDEHFGGKENKNCAELIYEWLQKEGHGTDDPHEKKALEQLARFTYADDMGHLKNIANEFVEFTVANILSASNFAFDSHHTLKLGCDMIDALYHLFTKKAAAWQDFEQRIEGDSKWGKVFAIDSELIPGDPFDAWTYTHGGVLMILVDKINGYRQFRAKSDSDVDLTETFETLKKMEPDARWWLHPNKRLLVIGGNVTVGNTDITLSKLSREELLNIVRI